MRYKRNTVKRLTRVLGALLLGAAALGCAAGGGTPGDLSAQRADKHFSLTVLPESFIDESSAGGFGVESRVEGDELTVEVRVVDARALKALYFELEYDADRLSPLKARATSALSGRAGTAPLELAVTSERGRVHFGQVLPRWQEQGGFSGDAVLARLRFARRPFGGAARSVSTPPLSAFSATKLSLSATTLLWGYYSQGDYNQDRLVTISDLTPLGANFNESVAPEQFPADSAEAVVDGDNNGQINIADITPIGANFGRRVDSYNIYGSATGSPYPASPDAESTVNPIGSVTYDQHLTQVGQNRLQFSFSLQAQHLGLLYWVRPADASGEGTPSNLLDGNDLPVADIVADKSIGLPPLTVNFDGSASSDSDGTIVKYEWDLDGDNVFELDTAAVPTTSTTYDENGTFPVHLRVTDDGGAVGTATKVIVVDDTLVGPTASFTVDSQLGDAPFQITFDATSTVSGGAEIVAYEWDFDGDGEVDVADEAQIKPFIYETSGVFTPRLRVVDEIGLSSEQDTVVVIGDGGTNPPADSILAIPLDPTVSAGQPLTYTVYTYRSANPFKFMNGTRLVVPSGASYMAASLNVGVPGGTASQIDGIWLQVSPDAGMLVPDDNFLTPVDLGGGQQAYDISVTPLGGVELPVGTGAMFNISFSSGEDLAVAFQQQDEIKRTYYSDGSAAEYFWAFSDNAGIPAIDVQ